MMYPILQKLAEGGDRRSLGRADEVAAEIAEAPDLVEAIFEGMLTDDPVLIGEVNTPLDHTNDRPCYTMKRYSSSTW